MKSNIKIAFCTDFSENARVAFESLMFNSWSFNMDIDVIHLVENNYQESLDKINAFEVELQHSLYNISEGKIHMFQKNDMNGLLNHLNSTGYFGVVVGLQGNNKGKSLGSFIQTLFKDLNCNLTVVPMAHEVKIENRVMMAVELKNIRFLYMLLKAQVYLKFNFSKLTIVVKAAEEQSPLQAKEIEDKIKSIFPDLNREVIIHGPSDSNSALLEKISSKYFDYGFVFKGDYFDNLIFKLFESSPDMSKIKEKVVRSVISESDIELAKNDSQLLKKIELRDF